MGRHKYKKHREKYRPGDYKVRDDVSGLTVMNSQCRTTWDGLRVSRDSYDPKQPQLVLHPGDDRIYVDNPRPTSENDEDLPTGLGPNRDEL